MKNIKMNFGDRSYDITVGKGLIKEADKYFNLHRKIFIITDSGVPSEYSECIRSLSKDSMIYTVPSGEGSKSIETLTLVLEKMSSFGMGRRDAVVAVGGGMVGDLSGFAAAIYMRGIDFYNVPTTLLSQVDSSIGGKTAINLSGIKNNVGAFHQPCGVIIDTDTLNTLPKRQISAGLAEAVKMSVTSDAELFDLFERSSYDEIVKNIESVIIPSLLIKKRIVEKDETESAERRILNFGHTFGHTVESIEGLGGLYHGECVAIGMIPMCGDTVRERVKKVLSSFYLPTDYLGDLESALELLSHDKKRNGECISVVISNEIGTCEIKEINIPELCAIIRANVSGGKEEKI